MEFNFEKYFSEVIGVCVKDLNKRVLFQNKICKSCCGDRENHDCEADCMSHYSSEGVALVKVKKDIFKRDKNYDAVIINDGNHILTLLYALTKKIDKEIEFFKKFALTPRELAVVSQVLRGFSNAEIGNLLFVSQKTVKTHINNIYKKLPPEIAKGLRGLQ